MKHLPKHLRPRWRYLAVEVETWPDASLNRGTFQRELWYAAQNLFGDAGSADADLTVLGFDSDDCVAETIVRARRGHVDEARAALACIDDIGGDPVGVRVRGVSGTVRACSERYLHGRAGFSEQRDVVFENESRTATVRDSLLDVSGPDGFTGATQLDLE
ncbi:RNaseP subunit 14 [Haloferax elongans ATCC BAA-1513]|uniref:Ribonuclease P protein component 2 n=1 Tax=Haloferax elongans ATCC BAA-1513 TaxID=1230453 RepID=M0HRF4_HALEO|nr:Rpp14/Pop5 family protein [Haloferax elongans]ELZ85699.1 RNaseP subunit 14 [Haloferax elongans ATCC BAA-1513]